jgi:two-component system phosphate regulon sensor histidine kinase PhoR
VTLAASPAAGQEVVVRITDTGIGVPRDEISRLGERFYRVDKTRSRELGGTGLGLSIVKHLMAAHKGRMEIESQLGRGTSVSLYFPAA